MLLDIVEVGDPILRKRARPLEPSEIQEAAIQDLIQNMQETMQHLRGVGLAAPQIGHAIQLIVIECPKEYFEPLPVGYLPEQERQVIPFQVIINPRLTLLKAEHRIFFESCLSIPGFAGMVPRAYQVSVEGINERNEPVSIEAHAWHARIFQHEIDHLNGGLIVDRMLSRSFTTTPNFVRHWNGKSSEDVLDGLDVLRT